MDLNGSTPAPIALITGAASGIGLAIARRLCPLAHGGLILIDRDEAGLNQAIDSLTNPPDRITRVVLDVADPDGWDRVTDAIAQTYGRLDWAVVNAGIAGGGDIADLAFEDWRRVLSINLDGAFLTLKAAMRLMRGQDGGGSIVTVGSAAAVKPEAGAGAYGTSKAGLLQLSKVAAKEGAAHAIRVNTVLPGGVETTMWTSQPLFKSLLQETGSERAAFDRLAAGATPLGRFATADDVARLILILLVEASPLTGAALTVDGGYTL